MQKWRIFMEMEMELIWGRAEMGWGRRSRGGASAGMEAVMEQDRTELSHC
jgi:hypothetical protein